MEEELFTVDEIASFVKVPKSFFYQPNHRKGPDAIPCLRMGKYLRYRLSEVMAWLEKRSIRS